MSADMRDVEDLLALWGVEGPLLEAVRHREGKLWTCEVKVIGLRWEGDLGLLSIEGPSWLLGTLLVSPTYPRVSPWGFYGWLRDRIGRRVVLEGGDDCVVFGAPDFGKMVTPSLRAMPPDPRAQSGDR